MRRVLILLLAVGACTFAAGQQMVQHETAPLKVTYKNGAVETYLVDWLGQVNVQHWETGHPSVPLKGWITDTRQCHWIINGNIVRKLYLINQAGQPFERQDFALIYDSTNAGQGSDLKVTALRPENCGDANDRFNSDVNNANVATRSHFNELKGPDLEKVKTSMRQWPNVTNVE